MGDIYIEGIFLVLTNLAFGLPAYAAYSKELWHEGSIYLSIIFVSGWNHFAGCFGVCLIKWGTHCYGGHTTMSFLDLYVSCQILFVTLLMLSYPLKEGRGNGKQLNHTSKFYATTICAIVSLLLMLDKAPKGITFGGPALYAGGQLILVGFVYKYDLSIDLHNFKWGAIWLGATVVMLTFGEWFKSTNWFWHSLWHVFVSLSLWYFIECKKSPAELARKNSSGYIVVPLSQTDSLKSVAIYPGTGSEDYPAFGKAQ